MKKNKKARKKKHRTGCQKKDLAFLRRGRASNIRAQKHFISGGGFCGLLPDSILEGVGDSLDSAVDRYTYIVSVPNMYHIVGGERVAALRSESWLEAWEARRQAEAARAAKIKKIRGDDGHKAKQEWDSVGGTPFNGLGL